MLALFAFAQAYANISTKSNAFASEARTLKLAHYSRHLSILIGFTGHSMSCASIRFSLAMPGTNAY